VKSGAGLIVEDILHKIRKKFDGITKKFINVLCFVEKEANSMRRDII
jgi:hypothetical protein